METEKQRLGFIDQIICSVQPSRYKELIGLGKRKVIGFILLLSFCIAVMKYAIPTAGWFVSFGGLNNLFENVLPAIELQDGKLSVGNKIEIGENSLTYILVDTERVEMQESDIDTEKYLAAVLIAEENLLLYNSDVGISELRFSGLNNLSLTNESLIAVAPIVYLVLGITFVLLIGTELLGLVSWGLMMALCCWGPFRIKGTEGLTFGNIFSLAIFSQTVMGLFAAFNTCVSWVPDTSIFYYLSPVISMFILTNGLRKCEEKAI